MLSLLFSLFLLQKLTGQRFVWLQMILFFHEFSLTLTFPGVNWDKFQQWFQWAWYRIRHKCHKIQYSCMISKLNQAKLSSFVFRTEENSNCNAKQKESLVHLMLLKLVKLLKPPAIKTCWLLRRDDNIFGSQVNSWYEAWALESQLLLTVMESVSLADLF